MKTLFLALGIMLLCTGAQVTQAAGKEVSADMLDNVKWLGHDTFLFSADKTIYTDPFELGEGNPPADIILMTHSHRDHCSPDDLKKISTANTTIVTTPDCVEMIKGIANKEIITVKPDESLTVDGLNIETVRAYNTNKKFHPRANDWVGFIFTIKGTRYYHAGDTDHIPEMKEIKCNVALLPVSGTFVMTADEAVEAAQDMKLEIAVPMHYGASVGTVDDAKTFADALQGKVKVHIMDKSD